LHYIDSTTGGSLEKMYIRPITIGLTGRLPVNGKRL